MTRTWIVSMEDPSQRLILKNFRALFTVYWSRFTCHGSRFCIVRPPSLREDEAVLNRGLRVFLSHCFGAGCGPTAAGRLLKNDKGSLFLSGCWNDNEGTIHEIPRNLTKSHERI